MRDRDVAGKKTLNIKKRGAGANHSGLIKKGAERECERHLWTVPLEWGKLAGCGVLLCSVGMCRMYHCSRRGEVIELNYNTDFDVVLWETYL